MEMGGGIPQSFSSILSPLASLPLPRPNPGSIMEGASFLSVEGTFVPKSLLEGEETKI